MRQEPEDLDNLKGAGLAIVGTCAGLIEEATGSKKAGKLRQKIEDRFGLSEGY